MINVTHSVLRPVSQFLSTNAPAIFTAFGAAGVVGTAVLTGKAAYKSNDRIFEARFRKPDSDDLDKVEVFKAVWDLYLPAVTAGTFSIAAIVLSHRISSRRAAVLAAAYALNEGKLEEYQEKIKEKLGVKKEKDVRDEIAQDQINENYREGEVIFSPLDGKVMIRDEYSGRFFWGTIDEVNKVVNEINMDILLDDSKTLSDFYKALGLDTVSTSDYFGWNTRDRLEIDWSTCTTPDGKTAVHSFAFVNEPIINPEKNASFR